MIRLWSLQGRSLTAFKHKNRDPIRLSDSLWQFSPDGNFLLTTDESGTEVRDLQGKLRTTLAVGWRSPRFNALTSWFSAYKNLAATLSKDNLIRTWTLDGKQLGTLKGLSIDPNTNYVRTLQFSPDGQYVVTATQSGTHLWDIRGNLIKQLERVETLAAYFSHDGQHIILRRNGGVMDELPYSSVWNLQGRKLNLQEQRAVVNPEQVNELFGPLATAFSPLTGRFVSGDGTWLFLLDAKGDYLATLKKPASATFPRPQFTSRNLWNPTISANGERVARVEEDGKVRVWDSHGNQLGEYEGYAMALSPDGKQIVVVSQADNIPRIWRVDDLDGLIQRGCDWLVQKIDICPIKPK